MLFHRVDDVGEDKYCDIAMIEALEAARVPYILAVVPAWLCPAMAHRIQRYRYCTVFQHGFEHYNAMASGYPDEFPGGLGVETREKLRRGKEQIEDMIGIAVKGYTPPWNNTSEDTLRFLEELGFMFFSGHLRFIYRTTLTKMHVGIDPVSNYRPLRLRSVDRLYRQLIRWSGIKECFGVVYHPKLFPEHYRQLLAGFVEATSPLAAHYPWLEASSSLVQRFSGAS